MTRAAALAGLAVCLAAAGCGGVGQSGASRGSPAAPSSSPPAGGAIINAVPPTVRPLELGSSGLPAPSGVTASRAAAPVHIRIPAIEVDSPLEQVDVRPDGTIQVPADPAHPAWYNRGPSPGEKGPAVILGHLDSQTGPAVFYKLSTLKPADLVLIERGDGLRLAFKVEHLNAFDVDRFPLDQVYGRTSEPQLRLITCAGDYSLTRQRYLANVIVFASLAG